MTLKETGDPGKLEERAGGDSCRGVLLMLGKIWSLVTPCVLDRKKDTVT
jgi:hypothetical protein